MPYGGSPNAPSVHHWYFWLLYSDFYRWVLSLVGQWSRYLWYTIVICALCLALFYSLCIYSHTVNRQRKMVSSHFWCLLSPGQGRFVWCLIQVLDDDILTTTYFFWSLPKQHKKSKSYHKFLIVLFYLFLFCLYFV